MIDLLIRNAEIYDGSGNTPFLGSVGVDGGRIVFVGTETQSARETVDAEGLALSPGFIDVHSHSDQSVFEEPHRLNPLRMGVTTELAGNCGLSCSPASPELDPESREFLKNKRSPFFTHMAEEIAALETLELGVNQRYFAGHGLLRGSVLGLQNRHAEPEELAAMQKLLAGELQEGAAGVSTGLSYVPGIYCGSDELIALGRTAGEHGGIYTTHSRSESMELFECVQECIRIGREGRVPVNISHFKCVGSVFWEKCGKALSMIDAAIAEGVDISLDAYPYIAASTTTLSAIPPRFLEHGAVAFAQSLADPNVAKEIYREIYEVNDPSWDNSIYYVGLENFRIVRAEQTPWAVGKSYAEAAAELGLSPFDGMIELLRRNRGSVYECRFSMCEENVEMILKHPRCMVGSDGIYLPGDASAHPRAFGTFPRYLGRYIRERGILSREEGIRRITGMPAERYGLRGKGRIAPGYDADLTLFDYDTILDRADFTNPFLPNEGIRRVYVGGKLALLDNEPTGNWCGRYLREN